MKAGLRIDSEKIDKILIQLLPGIGDTLMFTPALATLRQNFPNAEIDALVMFRGSYELLETNPHLSRVILWEFLKKGFLENLKFILQLRKNRYALCLTGYPANRLQYNLVNFMVGARWRPTHRYRHLNLRCGGFLNHQVLTENSQTHNVLENLFLLKKIGMGINTKTARLEIYLREEEKKFSDDFIQQSGLKNRMFIGLHAGCALLKNHLRRRWAPENFAKLASLLKKSLGAEILIFGGKDEEELKETVCRNMESQGLIITGTTIRQTTALIGKCQLFVSNDSGLMHLAAAMGVPTVALFGPTHPDWVHPYGTAYSIVSLNLSCSPCFYYSPRPLSCPAQRDYECIRTLPVEKAFHTCLELLKKVA